MERAFVIPQQTSQSSYKLYSEENVKSEFLIVAYRIIETERRPLSARELVDLAQKRQLFSDNVAGRTPYQTMKSKLSVHMRRYGERSPFVRTQPGKFYLRALLNGDEMAFEARPIRPPKSREKVLAFATEELDAVMTWQGLKTKWRGTAKAIFSRFRFDCIPRFDVEQNNKFTQVLTYIMVCRGNALLAYRRGTYNRVDQFLRGAYCIGFGGHVTEEDLDLFDLDTLGVYECAARELSEELRMPEADLARLRRHEGIKIVGIINDDSTDVGRRHLAFVMQYETSSDPSWDRPERGEKGITQLQWIAPEIPKRVWLWDFEYWSQLCLREFASELTLARPTYRLIRRAPLKPPHILCVIGPIGSGKTSATDVLKSDFGYDEINSGQVMAELLNILPVPHTPRIDFQNKAWKLIQTPQGTEGLARRLIEIAGQKSTPRVLTPANRARIGCHCL